MVLDRIADGSTWLLRLPALSEETTPIASRTHSREASTQQAVSSSAAPSGKSSSFFSKAMVYRRECMTLADGCMQNDLVSTAKQKMRQAAARSCSIEL
jgi:hypothetical protein